MSGAKTTTVRTKRYGAVGDEFEVEGELFKLVEVRQSSLMAARDDVWKDEGMTDPDEFQLEWHKNHPERGFRATDSVWIHRFERA